MAISQRIEIRKPGFVPYEAEFTPRPGLEQVLRVELQSLEEARLAAIEPLIVNPAGQRMSLLNPDAFTMGASRREAGRRPNEAIRDVVLERPFYLSFNEVTNAQFRLFDSEHSSGTSNGMTLNNEQQPVVRIRWEQAAAFCNWLSEQEGLPPFYELAEDDEGELQFVSVNPESHGYRLPTEAEWAWAARRDNTAPNGVRKYSWEGELPPPAGAANLADVSTRAFLGDILFDYDDRTPLTASVGSFAPNQHGFYDLAGNVAEWAHDFYGASGSLSVERDPLGPEAGQFRVIRGSSWAHGAITELRLSFRDFGEQARDDVGFRVARYLEDE
jgi:formylglycine-generating enzyme required for sulfatase activity